ncbi:MAG: hypothetical protein ACLT63_15620 [Bacteroides xylanisolvens]
MTIYLPCLSLLFNSAQAQLPTPSIKKDKPSEWDIANYNPDDNLIFKIGAPNIVMGTAETLIRLLKQMEVSRLIFLSTIVLKYG